MFLKKYFRRLLVIYKVKYIGKNVFLENQANFHLHFNMVLGAMDPRCALCIFMGKTNPSAPKHLQQVILCKIFYFIFMIAAFDYYHFIFSQ